LKETGENKEQNKEKNKKEQETTEQEGTLFIN